MSVTDRVVIFSRGVGEWFNHTTARIVRRMVNKIAEMVVTNLELPAAWESAKTSARFEKEHLISVPYFKTRRKLFAHSLAQAPGEGLHLEFGTYKGDSINILAGLRPRTTFVGFDSFQGLPETWTTGARTGAFDVGGRLPAVRRNVQLVKGFFQETLPGFRREHEGRAIAFLHIDCDLYSATLTVLDTLAPMIRAGTVIVFDEYFNYPDWLEGEHKALTEFAGKHDRAFEYIGYIRTGGQVAVRMK